MSGKTIVLSRSRLSAPALNCGRHRAEPAHGPQPSLRLRQGLKGVFEKYGFEENLVDMSGGMSDE